MAERLMGAALRKRLPFRSGVQVLSLLTASCVPSTAVAAQQNAQTSPPSATPVSLLEAAQSVLQNHPLLKYAQAQVSIDRGLRQQASGAFDTDILANVSEARTTAPLTQAQQEQNALIGAPGNDQTTTVTQLSTGVSRLFRSGVSIEPQITSTRDVDNLLNPQGVNTGAPSLQISIPLLRGRGSQTVAAAESAAKVEVEASLFDLTQEISLLLTNVADDYWNLVATQQLLSIARQAEDRAATDRDNTLTLVNADRLPRENLNEVNANLAQSEAARIAAEQNVVTAQSQLGLDIGLRADQIATYAPVATETLPDSASPEQLSVSAQALETYSDDALHNRSDYLAALRRVSEEGILVRAAKNRLLPQLDASVNIGYAGLKEGRSVGDVFAATGENIGGPNATASLTYNFAPRNNYARGLLLQVSATQDQLDLQRQQLSRTISSSVVIAAQAVVHAALQAQRARQAVAFYQSSLEGQREKYHLGMASVIDVLTVEGLLTAAMTTEVQADLAYATALTQFRFATGTFVAPGRPLQVLNTDLFRTLPNLQAAPGAAHP